MNKLKITLVAMHSFPLPYVTHTGDIVILQLANALSDMGHNVSLVAPAGSKPNAGVKLLEMRASYGKYPPSSQECEQEAFVKHQDTLRYSDIVHDFSTTKCVANSLYDIGHTNVISTLMGGPWTQDYQPHNLCVWSESHRDRVLRGASDYEGTPTPNLAGHTGRPVKEAHVVNGGIDTDFYHPTYQKKNYILWMGRWSKVRGYVRAIEIARANPNTQFVFSGGMPENEYFQQEKDCASEAIELVKTVPNIKLDLLPADPDHHTYKRRLYQEARAFLYDVQFCEPFGMMQAEALACGTPVIGTNYGSVPEVVQDEVTGYVRENNVESLSDAISMIGNIDPRACREQAVRRFDIKTMAANYLIEYNRVINGNGWGRQ